MADFSADSSGTPSTITINSAVNAAGVTFDGAGYTVTGGQLNLVGDAVITANQNGAINSAIGGSAGLTLTGGGVLTLGGANTYSGPTTSAAAHFRRPSSGALGNTSGVAIDGGGVLDLYGNSLTVPSLSDVTLGTGGLVTNSVGGSVTLTLQPTGGSTTFSGVIEDGNVVGGQTSLTLNGVGTQVLAGPNTYTGLTTISAGILQIGNGTSGSIGNTSGFATGAGGVVAFNLPGPTTLTAPVSGGGGLQQMGPARWSSAARPRTRDRRSSAAAASRSLRRRCPFPWSTWR